jgi:hypothetical protein
MPSLQRTRVPALTASLVLLLAPRAGADPPFGIRVVDADTGRGVPLIELRTTHAVRYYTDSAGWVAFEEPGLLGREVYFHVSGHGYEHAADGFNYRGVALRAEPGGRAEIRVRRVNIAERLYRVTGGGIYRDSLLLGEQAPTSQPALNGLVCGQDSVLTAPYRGRIFWFWGDTARPSYPLGNFQVAGATSRLPGDGGLRPDVGVDLEYFVDARGFAREMAPIPGEGPTWTTDWSRSPTPEANDSSPFTRRCGPTCRRMAAACCATTTTRRASSVSRRGT